MEILVISPRPPSWLPPAAHWRDVHPAAPHAHHAERIITAAGFNAMHELAPVRERHHVLPFACPLDDQFAQPAAIQNTIVRPSCAITRSSR